MKVCVSHVRHQRILWDQKHAWVISSRSTDGFCVKQLMCTIWIDFAHSGNRKNLKKINQCVVCMDPRMEKSGMAISTNKAQDMRYQRALNNAQRDSIAAHNRNCTHGRTNKQTERSTTRERDSMYSVCLTCCHSYKRARFVFEFRYHSVVCEFSNLHFAARMCMFGGRVYWGCVLSDGKQQ